MTHPEIVKKLIGNVNPAGDSSIDEQRFKNLEELCDLVGILVTEISHVAQNRESYEVSVKKLGQYAYDFLVDNLGIKSSHV